MEKAIVVRLKKGKRTFEVLTHHGKVGAWRDGKADWNDVLFVDRILDHKGEQYTHDILVEAFGIGMDEDDSIPSFFFLPSFHSFCKRTRCEICDARGITFSLLSLILLRCSLECHLARDMQARGNPNKCR